MTAETGDRDIEEICAGHARPRRHRDLPRPKLWRIVQPVNFIERKFFEQAILDHGARAAETFFGGLKDESHRAVEITRLREITRRAQKNSGVSVMTAAVKAAGNGGTPAQIGFLLHRQRIHICAQADPPGAIALAFQQADDAGTTEAAMYLDPPSGELFSDDARCAMLLESDFRMGVKIAADGGEFVGEAVDQSDVGHLKVSVCEKQRRDGCRCYCRLARRPAISRPRSTRLSTSICSFSV